MKHKLTLFDLALWAALPMAHTSKIEGRLTMILDSNRRRGLPRRALVFGITVTAAALIPLAMLRPAVQAAPPQPQATAVFAESEAMQRERQYALENSRLLRGENFTPQAAKVQEQRLTVQPDDYIAHLCLLGYYLNSAIFGKPLTLLTAQPAYRQQVFWLIQHHPESLLFSREDLWVPRFYAPVLFEGDKTLWQAEFAKHPGDALILGNAAQYYGLSDRATGEKLLLQAQALEPKNPVWPEDLGELYFLKSHHVSAQESQILAQKSRDEYQLSASLTKKTPQP